MARASERYFVKLSRNLSNGRIKELSSNAVKLYVVLLELEQRFTKKSGEVFYRSDADLAGDMGVSIRTLQRTKKELLDNCPDLISSLVVNVKNTTKLITAYHLLE